MKARKDLTTSIYEKVFNVTENHENVNKFLKAVILEMNGKEYIVKNDNFGTRRKYADFTNGKKEAGLHPMQIVFSGIDTAKIFHDKYINEKNEICRF